VKILGFSQDGTGLYQIFLLKVNISKVTIIGSNRFKTIQLGIQLLEARLRERDRLKEERSRRFLPLARNLSESEEDLSIIAMLLDDYYQKSLHAPPVQKERSQTRPPKGKNEQAPHKKNLYQEKTKKFLKQL
jgi:hypothetical protein